MAPGSAVFLLSLRPLEMRVLPNDPGYPESETVKMSPTVEHFSKLSM